MATRTGATLDARRPEPAPKRAQVSRRALTVLVVDDAADTRYVYERYFHFRGMRVLAAADGIQALQVVEVDRPDAIVLDLAMPLVTGWDVLREMKAHAALPNIPISALTPHNAHHT